MADATERQEHWEKVYSTRATNQVSWFRPHLDSSLSFVDRLDLPLEAPVIDVGGGASTFVDDLLAAGHSNITVLDISAAALVAARARIGAAAGTVAWVRQDVLATDLPAGRFALWHDRAVFHFLVDDDARRRYRESMLNALAPDGYAIVATFSRHAPPRCSGLPVERYDADSLAGAFAPALDIVATAEELHVTPGGVQQPFVYCLLRRAPAT
jgi:SAM-dependent methyltransferase